MAVRSGSSRWLWVSSPGWLGYSVLPGKIDSSELRRGEREAREGGGGALESPHLRRRFLANMRNELRPVKSHRVRNGSLTTRARE